MADNENGAEGKRRWRLRFSLRTLILFVLLVGSAGGLWWRWEAWYIERLLRNEPNESFGGAAFSPDGKTFAVRTETHIRVWPTTGGGQPRVLTLDAPQILSVEFSPDGGTLYACCQKEKDWNNYYWQFWETRSWTKRAIVSDTWYRSFSHDGKYLLDSSHLRMANVEDGKQVLCVGKPTGAVWGFFPPPEGEQAQKINAAKTLQEYAEHAREFLVSSTVSGDKRVAATNILDTSTTRIWNLISGEKLSEIPVVERAFRLSPDGSMLSTWNETEGAYSIWDTRSAALRVKLPVPGHVPVTTGVEHYEAFSQHGKLFAASREGVLRVWDCGAARLKYEKTIDLDGYALPQSFHDNDSRMALIVRLPDGRQCVELRKSENGDLLARFNVHPDFNLAPFVLSPDCSRIVMPYNDFDERGSLVAVCHRRRPEQWWGVAWLPEFWLTIVFSGGLVWSVWRDRRDDGARAGMRS
ncbi:MAG TPA: WD40 repeat domain-containing protein [Planctomycetota bacterium]|jgi:WD40 repeat protein